MTRRSVLLLLAALSLACWAVSRSATGNARALEVQEASASPEPEDPRLPDPAKFDSPLREKVDELVRGIEAHPTRAQAWGDFAMLCHAHERYRYARIAYREAERLDATDSLWPHLLGVASLAAGDDDEAARAFRASAELEPHDVVARCQLGAISMRHGEPEAARRYFLDAVKIDSRNVIARVGLGELALGSGARDVAARSARLVLEVSPRSAPAHALLARVLSMEGETDAASFHRRWGESGEVARQIDPYVERVFAKGIDHAALVRRAERAARRGDWPTAKIRFEQARKLRPDRIEILYRLGISCLRAEARAAGIKWLEQIRRAHERYHEARLEIARACLGAGELSRANDSIERAESVRRSPASVVARAEWFAASGMKRRAISLLEDAAADYPREAVVQLELGKMLLERGREEQGGGESQATRTLERTRAIRAARAFEAALLVAVDLEDAYLGAGSARMQVWELSVDADERASQLAAAIVHFERGVRLYPEKKRVHVAYLRALHTAGRLDEFRQAVVRARERWPADPLFRRRRANSGAGGR